MSNFASLNNYLIPTPLLLELLEIYKLIGNNSNIEQTLIKKAVHLEKKALETDCFKLIEFLKINVSYNRARLIITKDSLPKNKEEKMVTACKQVLQSIRELPYQEHLSINSSDILDYLKKIYGNNIKFNANDFKIHGSNKRSVRYEFNKVFDEYNEAYDLNKYEPIILSCILIMEMYNIKPYSEYNDLAIILTYYYLLNRCGIKCFKYTSFIELYLDNETNLLTTLANGSINYDQGTLFFSNFVKLTLDLIKDAYHKIDEIMLNNRFYDRAFKSDYLEQTIIYDLPTLFSKEDIIEIYPEVSPSTIMRCLSKLHKMNYIIPLGTGRSAKWKKIIDPNNLNYAIGAENETKK